MMLQSQSVINNNYTKNKNIRELRYLWKTKKTPEINGINIYAANIGALRCIKQIVTDIKGEINSTTIILG